MKTLRSHAIYLFLIFIVAAVLRIPFVGSLPKGLNWDESAYGYNAFSLWKTGHDEWGVAWPIFLKSFGEYKPALLSYLLIPSLMIFSDWNFAIRFVCACLGVTGVLATYFLFLHFTRSKKTAALTSLILAITPWHIHYSRAVMDPIISHTLLIIGMIGWTRKSTKTQIIGAIFLILSMYTYNAERVFIPLLLFFYAIIFWRKEFWKHKLRFVKKHAVPLTIMAIGIITIVLETLFGVGGTRSRIVSVFHMPEIQYQLDQQILRQNALSIPLNPLTENRKYVLFLDILRRYFLHFRPDFLFFANGNLSSQHGFMHYGNLLLIMLPFLLIGIAVALRKFTQLHQFLFVWVIIGPIASALTIDVPHSGRTLVMLPALTYFIVLGVQATIQKFSQPVPQKIVKMIILLLFVGNVSLYVRDYFVYFPEESFKEWQGYYVDLVPYLYAQSPNYQHVLVTNFYDEPLIFYAWYNRVDPKLVQTAERNPLSLHKIGNVEVMNYKEINICTFAQKNTLIVADPSVRFLITTTPQHVTYNFDRIGTQYPSFYIYDTNKLNAADTLKISQSCGSSLK